MLIEVLLAVHKSEFGSSVTRDQAYVVVGPVGLVVVVRPVVVAALSSAVAAK